MKEIQSQIKTLWEQEEKYWGQRSRLKWLKWGDRNSKKFHATTLQRRGRNKLLKIKSEAGVWAEGTYHILQAVEEYYSDLFTTTGPRDIEQGVGAIPNLVPSDCNEAIHDQVSNKEVKQAIDSMGELKAPGA